MKWDTANIRWRSGEFLYIGIGGNENATYIVGRCFPHEVDGVELYLERIDTGEVVKNNLTFRQLCEFIIHRRAGDFDALSVPLERTWTP